MIVVKPVKGYNDPVVAGFRIDVPASSITHFKELIHRGGNLWPDAPAEIKEFVDLVCNGEVMQNYRSPGMSGSVKPSNM